MLHTPTLNLDRTRGLLSLPTLPATAPTYTVHYHRVSPGFSSGLTEFVHTCARLESTGMRKKTREKMAKLSEACPIITHKFQMRHSYIFFSFCCHFSNLVSTQSLTTGSVHSCLNFHLNARKSAVESMRERSTQVSNHRRKMHPKLAVLARSVAFAFDPWRRLSRAARRRRSMRSLSRRRQSRMRAFLRGRIWRGRLRILIERCRLAALLSLRPRSKAKATKRASTAILGRIFRRWLLTCLLLSVMLSTALFLALR